LRGRGRSRGRRGRRGTCLRGFGQHVTADQANCQKGDRQGGKKPGPMTQTRHGQTQHRPPLLHPARKWSPALEMYLPEIRIYGNAHRTAWQSFCQVKLSQAWLDLRASQMTKRLTTASLVQDLNDVLEQRSERTMKSERPPSCHRAWPPDGLGSGRGA
jgi:hypothetical protein